MKQQSKATLAAFNKMLKAAGVLIEGCDFTPCQVVEMLDDALHRVIVERGPQFIPTWDEQQTLTLQLS
jgi:hypothetical protein